LTNSNDNYNKEEALSTEENKAIASRFAQVWGKESLTTIDELADPNLSVAYPILGEVLRGQAGFKQFLTGFHAAFPDADTTIEDVIAEGDKVAIRWTLRGTHQGELLGIPATGKPVTVPGITIYRIVGGKIVEERGEEDGLGLLQQLGVVPTPRQGAS
jgi:steroid delta-isomerase-like uncharacterized protein